MSSVDDLALIREFEGFEAKPYQDSVGVWTIGYGSTRTPSGQPVTADTPSIDEPTAGEWLDRHCSRLRFRIRELSTILLEDGQAAALLSFCYNLGLGSFRASTLRKMLNRGDLQGAADQFLRWVYAGGRKLPGLERRRGAERALFLNLN